jgi:hypothetical protein
LVSENIRIDKPFENLPKRREKTSLIKLDITINTNEIRRDYFENLYSNNSKI